MATVKPFKAYRPSCDKVKQVAALPYDVVNRQEARQIAEKQCYSFLHVDRPEVDLDPDIDLYDKRVYEKARDNLWKMIEDGIYIQDEKPYIYLYRLIMNNKSQIGIVGCVSIDEYEQNIIKKHELTRADKEQDRINHVDYCNANTGPIFLTYHSDNEINNIVNKWIDNNDEVYDFISDDNIRHTVWVVDNSEIIDKIQNKFKNIEKIYIADGHHRAASAVKVGLKRRKENPGYNGNEEYNYFLSVVFPGEQLNIMDYNRVVKDLNGLSEKQFIKKIKQNFEIFVINEQKPFKPQKRHEFGMYLNKKWYRLEARKGTFDENSVINKLDVSILQNNLLQPILNIKDPRSDKRIDFIGGIRGLEELERRVNKDMKVAFSMYPTSISELMEVADQNQVMPPKSTWFEPKLRSGIFIHML